ncbi:MAG: hypothetical protein AUG51_05155 [Acidobacteria bacterium 13_1_20CM_3_53_8]|nr:MAG: hypothetical protein AUG51_05155 [Acidobacteria bacterium 13_1_20CM_3_53_8]
MMSLGIKHQSIAIALFALILICGEKASAQDAGLGPEDTISVNTRLVRVSVSATDTRRHRAIALDASTLKLFADDREQQIAFIQQHEAPTTVAFLVDISDSMRGVAAQRTRHIVSTFVKAADPRNNYVLFVFNNRFKRVGEYAGDQAGRKALISALEHQKYGGGTALYTSARDALRKVVETRRQGKLAFIIITDGVDNASFANYRQMGNSLDTFGGFACAFVVSTPAYADGAYVPESETSRIAARLSEAIGAEAFVARGLEDDVTQIAQRVAEMMTLSVELSFYPEFPTGEIGAHSIRVEYSNKPRNVKINSRTRYIIEATTASAGNGSF